MKAEIFIHLVHWDIPELSMVPGTQEAVTSFWMNNVTDTFAFPKSHLLSHWFQGLTLCYLECQACLGILVRFLHTLLGCYKSTVPLVPLLKVSHAPAHQNVLAMFSSVFNVSSICDSRQHDQGKQYKEGIREGVPVQNTWTPLIWRVRRPRHGIHSHPLTAAGRTLQSK